MKVREYRMAITPRINSNNSGDVTYGHNVVMSIISLAACEIKGVVGLAGKGVRTETVSDTINVDVYIDVAFGCSCSDVAYRVQENVKRGIETMTDFKVGVVNVNILGVTFEDA